MLLRKSDIVSYNTGGKKMLKCVSKMHVEIDGVIATKAIIITVD